MSVEPNENEPAIESEVVSDAAEDNEEESEVTRAESLVQLLPLHAAPRTGKNSLKMTRAPGRPRKVERMPNTSDLEYHAHTTIQKVRYIESDPVVSAVKNHADADDMLRIIKLEVAREIAALQFQRMENEKHGRDTSQISARRIDAFKKFIDIELDIKKLGVDVINLKSEKMQRVFAYFVEQLVEVAANVLTPEQADVLFSQFQSAMTGWEDRCSELVTSLKDESSRGGEK